MAKLMSNRELELFKVAVLLAKRLADANPEVGMGPSLQTIAQKVAEQLSFDVDPDDIIEVCEEAGGS